MYSSEDRVRLRSFWLQVALSGLHVLGLAGGFWYVAARAGAGRLTLGDLALYLGAVAQVEQRLRSLSQSISFVAQTALHLRAFFAFCDRARPRIALPPPGKNHASHSRLSAVPRTMPFSLSTAFKRTILPASLKP